VEIRPVGSLAEYRGAMAVNAAAWGDAYADVLPDAVLAELGVPDDGALRERYEAATGPGGCFLVAVDDAAVGEDQRGDASGGDHDDGRAADEGSEAPTTAAAGVIGFAAFVWAPGGTKSFVGDDDVGLRAIYVHPERQGEGVGSALLAEGVERVPDRERVVLETFAANDDARAFYEARGFERVGASSYEIEGESYETAVYARSL